MCDECASAVRVSGECASVVRVYLYGECMVSAIVWYERDREMGAREIERDVRKR